MQNKNMLVAEEVKYEFRKTARQEANDALVKPFWDESGRLFVLQGARKPTDFFGDKGTRQIKIFNMFGEQI